MDRLGRQVPVLHQSLPRRGRPRIQFVRFKPAGEGLTIYLVLTVELVGPAAPDTGLLVNVSDIDRAVRRFAVPVFAEQVRAHLAAAPHVGVPLLDVLAWSRAAPGQIRVRSGGLTDFELESFGNWPWTRKSRGVMYFSEKFEFAATHKLWNDGFSDEQNVETFGKCANPSGHGHNYLVEVTIRPPPPRRPVHRRIRAVWTAPDATGGQNPNLDVPAFQRDPTVENIAVFAWERLAGRFDVAALLRHRLGNRPHLLLLLWSAITFEISCISPAGR
jgi:6-pyruvoyltetrahydropterin/6-carboxytetrahydropterin synthase